MTSAHDPNPRPSPDGSVAPLLKIEGAAVMLASGLAFQQLGGSWVWFAALFLVPDCFMVGYLKDRRVGAIVMLGDGLKYRTAFKHTHLQRA